MSRIQQLAEKLKQKEKSDRMKRVIESIDGITRLVIQRDYRGDNPAMVAVHRPLKSATIVMLGITLATLIFGTIVPMESASIAKGTVVVLSNRKTVQHLEGGIIKAIMVKEGQTVKQGDPLLEISDITPRANREIVQSELRGLRATELRLMSLRDEKDQLVFPDDILDAAVAEPELAKKIQTQTELFLAQRDTQIDKLQTLNKRIAQSQEEIIGLRAQIRSGDGQLALITQEIDSVKELLAEGLATKPRLLALQRQAEELRGNRGQNIAQIAQVEQGINETQLQIINLQNEYNTAIAEEMRDVQAKIGDAEEKLRAVVDVMSRTVVAAPSEGIITGMKFHTVGGVIPPGEPIMDIVPQDDLLVLEVRVSPADIDVVKPGLETRVVFPAYKSRRMPLLHGKVTRVSADAFSENVNGQSLSFFKARVEVDNKQLSAMEQSVNLYPGMEADVFIHVSARSFLGYLFSPISESMGKAFKEE